MGQLEKYGLYVLCLLIFLIFGVTIWGGDLPDAKVARGQGATAELKAPPRTEGPGSGNSALGPSIQALIGGAPSAVSPNTGGDGAAMRHGTAADRPLEVPPANELPRTAPSSAPSSAPGSAVAGAPVGQRSKHRVVSGDSLEAISRRYFNTPAMVAEIQRLNPAVQPHRLPVGSELWLPTAAEVSRLQAEAAAKNAASTGRGATAEAAASKPTSSGTVRYTVTKGDTFEGIAIRQLGSRTRVDEIRNLNPTIDPTRIRAGQHLVLPKK